MRIAIAVGSAALVALAAAGCETNTCGQGSYEVAGGCVPALPPSCGPGTELIDGVCTPIEGQEIECAPMTHLDEGACTGDVDVPGNATRYVEMVLSKPRTVDALVNPVIADALASGDMVILTSLLQPTQEDLFLYAGPGMLGADGFFDYTGEYDYETVGVFDAGGFSTEPFTWVIAGLTEQPIIVVDTVLSEGELDITSGARLVKGGVLTGVITEQNARDVLLTAELNMYDALIGLGVEQDVDYDGDGTNDSWEASGRFRADPVWMFPPP